jgi:prepilin-type N-terminal cleavage/methylation domain
MDNRGVTSLELVCVMAILSILASQILPKLTMLEKSELDYETAYLVSDLRWMQQRSRSMHWSDGRFFGTNPDRPLLMRITAEDYTIDMNETIKEHKLPPGVKIYLRQSPIKFSMDGAMLPPQTIQVFKGGKSRWIIMDRVGRIRVQRN